MHNPKLPNIQMILLLTVKDCFFYAGFSPALEVQKSVRFLHFTRFSQITIELEPDIYYQWCSKMTVMRFVVKVYMLI